MSRAADRYRSFFWPAVLIVVGLFALLINAGLIPLDRLYLLFDLWPVILIVIGLAITARRTLRGSASSAAAVLILALAVGGAVAYVAVSPSPSLNSAMDSHAAAGSVERASVEIDAGAATGRVSGSSELGGDLYRAHIEYSGQKPQVDFNRANGS